MCVGLRADGGTACSDAFIAHSRLRTCLSFPVFGSDLRSPPCHHNAEPGCAINLSLDDGSLEFDRWQSYQKLQREQAYAARRENPQLERETRNNWKKIHKQ